MSIQGFDVVLGTVGYNLAEDAEGQHYDKSAEPLRPPNSVTVQGESSQKFQIRPDILQWSITDWSGGEGQLKFDPQQPNRHYQLRGSVFSKPGEFHPMWFSEFTVDSGGTNAFAVRMRLLRAGATVYGFATATANMYEWDTFDEKWSAAQALTGAAAANGLTTDGTYVYLLGASHTYRAAVDATAFSTVGSGAGSPHDSITVAGDNCYVGPASGGFAIREFLKSGSTPVDVAYHTIPSIHSKLLTMDGKVYSMASELSAGTQILEITPSSAAGTGFGGEIALLSGFQATSMWSHSGTLFLGGHETADQSKTSIMYLTPGGEYGTLGKVNEIERFSEVPQGNTKTTRWLEHFFWYSRSSVSTYPALFCVDAVSGGFCVIGNSDDVLGLLDPFVNPVDSTLLDNDVFISIEDDAVSPHYRTFLFQESRANQESFFITPWNDFGISGEKILSSIELTFAPLPADWNIQVIAFFDSDLSSSLSLSAIQGDDVKTSEKLAVSHSAFTQKFNSVRFKVTLNGPDDGPTSWPAILGMDVFVQISRPQTVWRLLLNLSDDHSGGQGHSGAQKIDNLETLNALNSATGFADGYKDRTPGVYTGHSVLIDEFKMILDKPGEGVAAVTLVEVA